MNLKQNLKYWLPVLVWMVFIFWMSTSEFTAANTGQWLEPMIRFFIPHISQPNMDLIHAFVRKCAHLTEYFILGLMLFRAFRGDSKESHVKRWALWAVLLVAIYASSDEFHQNFVPGRTPSPIDVGIDTAGGALAQLVGAMWARHSRWLASR